MRPSRIEWHVISVQNKAYLRHVGTMVNRVHLTRVAVWSMLGYRNNYGLSWMSLFESEFSQRGVLWLSGSSRQASIEQDPMELNWAFPSLQAQQYAAPTAIPPCHLNLTMWRVLNKVKWSSRCHFGHHSATAVIQSFSPMSGAVHHSQAIPSISSPDN